MFEITSDDISRLGDEDLRTLVGRLCESEVKSRRFSPSVVTWGGNQNAADGGIDVRVALPNGAVIDGFVPRPATGFQVKSTDMPPASILEEMRPAGTVRPSICQLAVHSGAYIIVSSAGSAADSALQTRREAMAAAVKDIPNANGLALDFYDRTRLATWVRDHAGLIPWVRERIGTAINGWHSFGAWAYATEGTDGEYLLDDELRIYTVEHGIEKGLRALEGIQLIRERLNEQRKVVRLIGLSGVGKTRLVQALFDSRYGENSLDPLLAIYTNIADSPDPPPVTLVSDLISARTRAILVIDNCPPELHSRLSDLCRSPDSLVSLITVEYDIRDDQTEGTDVFSLEPSSIDLIEKLIIHRFPHVSRVDARTVADASDGNARVAIAVAGTIGKNETIASVSDQGLVNRLFNQRNVPNDFLLQAAQALSLVYSYDGEDVSYANQAELCRLGALIGKSPQEMFRSTAELKRRDLVQQRGHWRAVLPHAIANRLAATALEDLPFSEIEARLVLGAPSRLYLSFSRRLGYLHTSQCAVAIVTRWFSEGGLLGNITSLNDLSRTVFANVAPVAPEQALAVLERGILGLETDESLRACSVFVPLLRSLAYDEELFPRCVELILRIAQTGDVEDKSSDARNAFLSLFTVRLSGTHATIEQRLTVIEALLPATDVKRRSLGLLALKEVLETFHFATYHYHRFDFGARSRDYGFEPRSIPEVNHWFGMTLNLSEKLASSRATYASGVGTLLAEQFRGLWTRARMYDRLDEAFRAISDQQFWKEGWIAVCMTLQFDSPSFSPEILAKLRSLEAKLRPISLAQRVRAVVLSNKLFDLELDFEDADTGNIRTRVERKEGTSRSLGQAVATDEQVFYDLAAELVSREGFLWSFGRGLLEGTKEPNKIWNRFSSQIAATSEGKRNPQVLCGFLSALHASDSELANRFLDDAVQDPVLATFYPLLQVAVGIDDRGLTRLMRSLQDGNASMWMFRQLAGGGAADSIPDTQFKDLLLKIAARQDGFPIATDILHMRLFDYENKKLSCPLAIVEAGRELLRQVKFSRPDNHEDYRLGEIATHCLVGVEGIEIVQQLCRRMKDSISRYETFLSAHDDLLQGLFAVHPIVTLNSLCADEAKESGWGFAILSEMGNLRKNPMNSVPERDLLNWCDEDPTVRYPAIASAINAIQPSGNSGSEGAEPRRWTNIAMQLLEKAPDRVKVLRQFVEGFYPSGWSGSMASAIELNAKVLDELENYPDSAVTDFVVTEKIRLAKIVERERETERQEGRRQHESFE